MTKDVSVLTHQVEDLLLRSNELLEDVNHKVATIDPLFNAATELGESVSDLNQSSRNAATKLGAIGTNVAKASVISRLTKNALNFMK